VRGGSQSRVIIGENPLFRHVAAGAVETIDVGWLAVRALRLEALIEEKRALGRDKDQAALRLLEMVLRKRH